MEEVLDELGVIEGKRSDVNKVLTYEILKINKQTDTHSYSTRSHHQLAIASQLVRAFMSPSPLHARNHTVWQQMSSTSDS